MSSSQRYPPDQGPIKPPPPPPDSGENTRRGTPRGTERRGGRFLEAEPVRVGAGAGFEMLGFSVKQLGDAGDTDVLVEAPIGDETYSVVVDAKAAGPARSISSRCSA